DLTGAADPKVRIAAHFEPMRDPTRHATDGEHDGEHVLGDAECLVDDAGVEVDVRVELAAHEVVVLERDLLELHADLEQLARYSDLVEHVATGLLEDRGARVVALVDAM